MILECNAGHQYWQGLHNPANAINTRMNPEDVKRLIETGIPEAKAFVVGDGSKFEATVVSSTFEGLNSVKKHQLVYGTVTDHIISGTLHALTIKAYTPEEWEALDS